MSKSQFHKDSEFGQLYETMLLQFLDYDSYEQAPSDKPFYLWDIKIVKDGMETSYEVKADKRAIETKNIAIEYCNKGSKSGIQTSKCNYWAHFCVDPLGGFQLYMIPRRELIKMINRGEYKRIAKSQEGAQFFLIEMSKIKQYLFKSVC
jgi:hypothetical protein